MSDTAIDTTAPAQAPEDSGSEAGRAGLGRWLHLASVANVGGVPF